MAELTARIFPGVRRPDVERVRQGVSTRVYRIRRGDERFYLRVLPEEGSSFALEVRAHGLLRSLGALVPEVVYFEHLHGAIGRSVMVTAEVPGRPVAEYTDEHALRDVLIAAGRDLARINSVPVAGFGWVRRDASDVSRLRAEHDSFRAFVFDGLEADLATLREHVFDVSDVAAIHGLLRDEESWLTVPHGRLAHGDFDTTHIYHHRARYTGIIDFGEIRGAGPFYDLGHFKLHDGEMLPWRLLPWLLEGYGQVTGLPVDHARRIGFACLLVAVKALALCARKRLERLRGRPGIPAIHREIAALYR